MKKMTKKKILVYILAGITSSLCIMPTTEATNQQSTTTVTTSNTATTPYELININQTAGNAAIGVDVSTFGMNLFTTTPPTNHLYNIVAKYISTNSPATAMGINTIVSKTDLSTSKGSLTVHGPLMINAVANGGKVVSTTSGNLDTTAETGGIYGAVSLNGLLQTDVMATGGTATLEGNLSDDSSATASAHAMGMSAIDTSTQKLAANSYVKANAKGGTANAELKSATITKPTINLEVEAEANALGIGARGTAFASANGLNIVATATGGTANAEVEIEPNPTAGSNTGAAYVYANSSTVAIGLATNTLQTTTLGNNTNITVTATGGTAVAAYESEIVGTTVDGFNYAKANVLAEGWKIQNQAGATAGMNTTITVTATGGTAEATELQDPPLGGSNLTYAKAGVDATGISVTGGGIASFASGTTITTTATGGKVTIGQDLRNIKNPDNTVAYAKSYGISNTSSTGNVTLNGNTTITTKATAGTVSVTGTDKNAHAQVYNDFTQAYALYNDENGNKITVNPDKTGIVKMQGDIVAGNGTIDVNLNGNTSIFSGTVLQTKDNVNVNLGTANGGNVTLNLDNGAKWYLANNSQLRGATAATATPGVYANTLLADADSEGRGVINVHTLNVGQNSLLNFVSDDLTRGNNLAIATDPNRPMWRVVQSRSGDGTTGGGFNFTGAGNTAVIAANLAGSVGKTGVFSDKIIVDSIPGTANTSNHLAVYDITASNTVKGNLLVMQYENANNATQEQSFTGRAINIGAIKATPILKLEKSWVNPKDNGWYLTGYTVTPSDTVIGASSMANASYGLLRTMDNNMNKRMGDLRKDDGNQGAWMRIYGGETNITGNTNMETRNIQGGYDIVSKTASGKNVTGILIEHSTSDNTFSVGKGETNNTRMGLYHAWLGENGSYYDITAKTGRMRNKITVYGDELTPGDVYGDYSSWNTTIGAEYGRKINIKNGFYYTPQIELVYGRINGADYMSSNNIFLKSSNINSFLGRLGITFGKEINANSNTYLSANLYHEFAAKTAIDARSSFNSSRLETDLKGTSFELVLGGNLKVAKNSNMYGEISKSFGGKVKNDWQIQLGARFGF